MTKKEQHSVDEVYDLAFRVLTEVGVVKADVASIKLENAERKHLDKMTQDHEQAIKGNGKAGLEKDVALLQEKETKRDRKEWFLYTLIVAEGVALILKMFV